MLVSKSSRSCSIQDSLELRVYGEMVATLASEASPNRGPGSSPGRRSAYILVAELSVANGPTPVRFRVSARGYSDNGSTSVLQTDSHGSIPCNSRPKYASAIQHCWFESDVPPFKNRGNSPLVGKAY